MTLSERKIGEMEGDSRDMVRGVRHVAKFGWRFFTHVLFVNSFHRVIKGTGAAAASRCCGNEGDNRTTEDKDERETKAPLLLL